MVAPRRVLILERDGGVYDFVSAVLVRAGYETDHCRNEQEVLEAYDPGTHALLVLEEEKFDLTSAGLRELRARNGGVPILLLYNGPGPSGPVQNQVGLERLTKPFGYVELSQALARLVP